VRAKRETEHLWLRHRRRGTRTGNQPQPAYNSDGRMGAGARTAGGKGFGVPSQGVRGLLAESAVTRTRLRKVFSKRERLLVQAAKGLDLARLGHS
jgi:hypothetical protein